jgi:hypothetical protein
VFGDSRLEQEDPWFRDNVLFYEYFHGATGRGLGASHQTGWTGLIALLLRSYSPSSTAQTAARAQKPLTACPSIQNNGMGEDGEGEALDRPAASHALLNPIAGAVM